MRISGTEPSSVIISQTMWFKKVDKWCPKLPKQAEAKRDGVMNPQNTISINFKTANFNALKRYESTEVDRRTWLHVPRGLTGPPTVTLTKKLKYKKEILLRCHTPFLIGFN